MLLLLSLVFFPLIFLYSFFLSLFTPFSFFLSVFLYLLFIVFLFLFPPPLFSLCTSIAFYTACHDRICHFYPSTAIGLLWVSFQDYPLVCRLPNNHHYTMLIVPRLIPRQKWLSLTPLNTLIRIRVKPFPYQPL